MSNIIEYSHHVDDLNRDPCGISVVMCTYNRSELLRDSLTSFFSQKDIKKIPHELLVIDNCSTDNTKYVTEKFSDKLQLRYSLEQKQGLSNARNRGIEEALGRVIAFVDDDVLFSDSWLMELYEGVKRWPKSLAFGGRAIAKWDVPKPKWFVDSGRFRMLGMVAHFDPKQEEGVLDRLPFGCNMAMRAEAFKTYGGFRPDLGRKGTSLIGLEEYDFFRRIKSSKETVVYLPKAKLYHRIMGNRSTKVYYINWVKQGVKARTIYEGLYLRGNRQEFIHVLKRLIKLAIYSACWILNIVAFRWNKLFAVKLQIMGIITYLQARKI